MPTRDTKPVAEILAFHWHDTELLDILVNRSEAGHNDTVRFALKWSDWDETRAGSCCFLTFTDCYLLEMTLNFGIMAAETIRDVWLDLEVPKLAALRQKFNRPNLACVAIETNSTASLIRVFATSFEISPRTPLMPD